jgi:hypothetical protein
MINICVGVFVCIIKTFPLQITIFNLKKYQKT